MTGIDSGFSLSLWLSAASYWWRPDQFYKEQQIHGKWVCNQCDTLIQEPMPAYVIDKGIATPELLSYVLVLNMRIIYLYTVNVWSISVSGLILQDQPYRNGLVNVVYS